MLPVGLRSRRVSPFQRNLCTEVIAPQKRAPAAETDAPQLGEVRVEERSDDYPSEWEANALDARSLTNYKILGTSRDKRPVAWRLLKAGALNKACSCLGHQGMRSTTTVTAVSTSFSTQDQVTTTTIVTSTTGTTPPAVTETSSFRAITSNDNRLFLVSGTPDWFYGPTPRDFQIYTLSRSGVLFSNSGDTLNFLGNNTSAFWRPGATSLNVNCSLTSALDLICRTSAAFGDERLYFYERSNARGTIIFLDAEERSEAVTIKALPEGC